MKPFSTLALAVALTTGASGLALAATTPSPSQAKAGMATHLVPAPTAKTAAPMRHQAMVGQVDNTAVRETTALNLLESHGYDHFSGIHRDGRNFDATVMQDGKQLQVTVNPDTGKITHRV